MSYYRCADCAWAGDDTDNAVAHAIQEEHRVFPAFVHLSEVAEWPEGELPEVFEVRHGEEIFAWFVSVKYFNPRQWGNPEQFWKEG